jgi:DNA-binding beta-propeller fold protein YncE
MKSLSLAFCAAYLLPLAPVAAAPPAVPQVTSRIPLHDGGWDILTVDPATSRVLIGRSDGVDAVDTRTSAVTPRLISGARFHSVTVVPGSRLAVATEKAGTAIVFDPSTGKVKGEVKTDPDADAAIYEPATHSVWVMNGDSGTISIVDPVGVRATGKVSVGGSLEFPALDDHGHLFVNVEDKNELAEIDIARRSVIRRVALAGCEKPTGLAYLSSGVLLSACANGVAKITRATDGKDMGDIAIGPRPDGAFADETRHRAYIPSGGDGTLSVIDTSGPLPRKIATVQTQVGARTGAVDPTTGVVYLPAAKFGAPPASGGRPEMVLGTVELLVVR